MHGEEEASGRSYLMLEGTDGQVYHIYRTAEMEELRSQRGLQTNSFIRLRKFGRGPWWKSVTWAIRKPSCATMPTSLRQHAK